MKKYDADIIFLSLFFSFYLDNAIKSKFSQSLTIENININHPDKEYTKLEYFDFRLARSALFGDSSIFAKNIQPAESSPNVVRGKHLSVVDSNVLVSMALRDAFFVDEAWLRGLKRRGCVFYLPLQ
ncbi:hypothetical protein CDAR_266581 [Caerostris darwini]|uniref:PIN domain-containing protein n=1 Tax=Caerostris darwini TaxID=1538125 RepID=A0AAV4RVB7_9ARAC|nr:hypothetical protein CDAR_266581 [Caerostris darwini]